MNEQLRNNPGDIYCRNNDVCGEACRGDIGSALGQSKGIYQGSPERSCRGVRTNCQGGAIGCQKDDCGRSIRGEANAEITDFKTAALCKEVCKEAYECPFISQANRCADHGRNTIRPVQSGYTSEQHSGGAVQTGGSTGQTYCPTGCPLLGPQGCTIACGNEQIECPMVGQKRLCNRGK